MLFAFYRFIVRALGPFLRLWVRVRAFRGLEEHGHFDERGGIASIARPDGQLIWIHAASVGEMRSILPLARTLLDKNPQLSCLITTVTRTAASLVRAEQNPRLLHQYAPFDHPKWVAYFLNYWAPDCVFWVESELWPTSLQAIKARGIPLALINARLSARSAKRWATFGRYARRMLGAFDVILAQSDGDAKRLESLGAHPILAGNLKYAAKPQTPQASEIAALKAQIGTRPCVLFASTHDGEEAIAERAAQYLARKHPDILTIVMPRHPARAGDIIQGFEAAKLSWAQRSQNEPIMPDTQIYLADTLGEAGLLFEACKIVYMGNSLISVPGGGHNPLEPAFFGCAIMYGPHMWNFADIDQSLRAAGAAAMVDDEAALFAQLDRLLAEAALCEAMGVAARSFVEQQRQVLPNVLEYLTPMLTQAGLNS